MKRLIPALLGLTAIVFAADEWTLPAEEVIIKPIAGADLLKANCLMCHSAEYITTQPPMTRDQWKASVTKMQQKYGAPLPVESVDPLLDYLVHGYGKKAP